MSSDAVATVVALWRYPVKSMMGEQLDAVEVTDRGPLDDRAYALVDQETRKGASAKFPRVRRPPSVRRGLVVRRRSRDYGTGAGSGIEPSRVDLGFRRGPPLDRRDSIGWLVRSCSQCSAGKHAD